LSDFGIIVHRRYRYQQPAAAAAAAAARHWP